MRGILFAIVLLLLFITGYFYWHSTEQDRKIINPVRTPVDADNRSAANVSATSPLATDEKTVPGVPEQLQQEARQYVAEITTHDNGAVAVDSADNFVRREDPISLFANKTFATQTLEQLKGNIKPDAPLTIVCEQKHVELISSKELIADSGGNLSQSIKILTGGNIKTKSIGEVIEAHPDSDSPISIIRKTKNLFVTRSESRS